MVCIFARAAIFIPYHSVIDSCTTFYYLTTPHTVSGCYYAYSLFDTAAAPPTALCVRGLLQTQCFVPVVKMVY